MVTNREHYDIDLASMSATIAFATWLTKIRSVDDPYLFMLLYNKKIEKLFEIWVKLEYNDN